MASPLDTLVVVVTASTKQLEKELNSLTAPNGAIGKLGPAATAVAATATAAFVAVGAAVAAVATKGIQAGTEFENQMTAAFKAVEGITTEMEDELTAGVRRIAQETGIS